MGKKGAGRGLTGTSGLAKALKSLGLFDPRGFL